MKCKRLLRFYFGAEALDNAINGLILRCACGRCIGGTEYLAERIGEITKDKETLGRLWSYLDGVISALCECEREVLKYYAFLRVGINRLSNEQRLAIKRVTTKFTRRLRRIDSFSQGVGLVGKYYCLIGQP